MRNKFIAGNWKLNCTQKQTRELITSLLETTRTVSKTTIMVAPSFTSLHTASQILQGKNILLGAQNCYWEDQGAFTGEVSAVMLKDIGCHYVILGHSERRQFFNETDENVNSKIRAVLRHNLLPIICVGETLEQRESGSTLKLWKIKCEKGCRDFLSKKLKNLQLHMNRCGLSEPDVPRPLMMQLKFTLRSVQH